MALMLLAKGKTRTGRLWVCVRDDRPFADSDPLAAAYFYSADSGGAHAERHLDGFVARYRPMRMPAL